MAREVIADLVAQISMDGTKFDKGMGQVNRQLKTVQEELKTARSRFRQTGDSNDFLANKATTLSGKLKLQETRMELLNKAYKESYESTGEFSARTQRLATQLERAKREMSETESELKDINEQLSNQPSKWTTLGEQAQSAGEKMQTAGRNMTSFGKSYTMGVTAPIVAGGVAVFKAASDFESAFAGVEKTFSGTEQELASLEQGIRDMAKEIPASTTEIAAVAEAAGQLGIESESIEDFTRTMIDLGEATNMTSETAATEFARFANIVGMSQNDFDKLGSTVVALGNSMATTEAEISSMAMRLAAQGSQVGMTEAQIMALSATMSSLGIEAEAGGTAMTTVLKKIDSAVGESGEELEAFASAAGVSSSEFAKAWESDPITALDMFIKGLSASGEEGENLTTILGDLGIKGIREADTMLRMAGASDLLTDAVKTSSGAWEENSALTDEAAQRYVTTESQLKILWNRVKDMGITLGEALIPAVMDAIDAAEPLIQKIEDGAQAFSEMTEEEQQTILKMIALVAAVGPASIVLGGLTTSIGGVLKVGGSLSKMLGAAKGAGLIGRIGLLGVSGPVGWAIAGVGALGVGIYALSEASKENIEETYNSIQARKEEIDATDEMIGRFEELQNKNELSTDEVLRYMDIMDELKNAKNEDTIAALTEEQQKLLDKSGLTNEEIEEFLTLNSEIVEKTPDTNQAISEQGNAYAETTEAVRELSRVERERLTQDTYMALTDEMHNQKQNLEEQKLLQDEIAAKENERSGYNQSILDISGQLQEKDLEIADLKERILETTGEEKDELVLKLRQEQLSRDGLAQDIELEQEKIDKIDKQIGKKQDSLNETNKELEAFDAMLEDYAQMVLLEQGIVSEKGKANEALDKEQTKLDENIKKLEEMKNEGSLVGDEYDEQNRKLNDQQGKIDTAKQKLEEMNTVAGKTVYKDLNIKTNPTIDSINEWLGGTITKRVDLSVPISPITQAMRSLPNRAYADGTDYHPGGPALVGEEGQELAKIGNRWSMLDFGITDLPRGTQVFTHDESKKIIGSLNQLPAYAGGVSPSSEADRLVSSLNNQPQQNEPAPIVIQNMSVQKESDIPAIAKELHRLQTQTGRVILG